MRTGTARSSPRRSTPTARTVRIGGLVALAGAFGLTAAMLAGGANPSVGVPSVFVLVSLSLVVGLSTAASP
jgi:hypothetical protein